MFGIAKKLNMRYKFSNFKFCRLSVETGKIGFHLLSTKLIFEL